jgi:hypothetical protein
MGFLSSDKPDIFVSYAWVNDNPIAGDGPGWVSTLVRGLRNLLAMKLGRKDAFEIWSDDRVAGNAAITPEVAEGLAGASMLVLVLSRGYLSSDWCRRELDTFLREMARRQIEGRRIFLVEFEPTERPAELADLLGYRFWVDDRSGKAPRTLNFPQPRDGDDRYYDLLTDLSHDISAEKQRIKDEQDAVTPRSLVSAPVKRQRVVYLAESTDDLEDHRDEVRRYLMQESVRVLPEIEYPRDASSFRGAVESDLAQSVLFVQLLSRVAGKKPAGSDAGYVAIQHQCAEARGMPILQWRSPDVDPSSASSESYRRLLGGESVVASDLAEFSRLVVRRIDQLMAPPPSPLKGEGEADRLVFINAEENDHALAVEIAKVLCNKGVTSLLPARRGAPERVREALVRSLVGCDALMMVHGDNPDWLVSQWDQFRKVKPKRTSSLKSVCLCDGPPPNREPCNLVVPGAYQVDCRAGIREELFEGFLSSL